MHSFYLKFGVVVHPAHSSRSQGGFIWAVGCLQGLQHHLYGLELTFLPVSYTEETITVTSLLHQHKCAQRHIFYNTNIKYIDKQSVSRSPVPICCSPVVTKEPSSGLGAIFVLIMILPCEKATWSRAQVMSECKLRLFRPPIAWTCTLFCL